MSKQSWNRLAWLAVLALLVPGGGLAQEPDPEATAPPSEATAPPEQEEQSPYVFGETINVRVVNIEVWVTNKKTGEPVTGLTIDDFELFEDKRPVKISNFYEYHEGEEVGGEEEEEKPAEPARPRSREDLFTSHPGMRTSDVPEEQRLSLMVYVDHFNLTPYDRNRVFRYLRQFLRTKLDRDDRVALVTYNRSVKMEIPFTSDASLIAEATYDLEKHTGGRTTQNSDRRDLLEAMNRDEAYYYRLLGRVRLHAESLRNDLQFTLDGLRSAVRQLAGIPGRKALLYVSNGLPIRPGEDLFWALEERFRDDDQAGQETSNAIMQALQYDASRLYDELASLANANRVTFYTLDAAGLRVSGMRSAEFSGTYFSTNIDSIHTRNLQDAIVYIADRTGGQSIINTNNILGGLDKIANDFEDYYSLGFSPSHGGTGRQYRLNVELQKELRKKFRVRHRNTYKDKPIREEMGDATLASLILGFQSNPLGVRFELERGPDGQILREDGNFLVTFLVRIPIENLVLVPVGDKHEAKVRVFVQAVDDKGRTSMVQEEEIPVVVEPGELEQARAGYWTYHLKLVMEVGDQRVAVGVRDDLSARTSFLSRVITVG